MLIAEAVFPFAGKHMSRQFGDILNRINFDSQL